LHLHIINTRSQPEYHTMTPQPESLGNVFQALADPTRRAVVHRLGAGPASTKDLAAPFDMALPSFMQHMKVLEESKLVTSEKVGRVRTWRIQEEELAAAESWIAELRAQWEDRSDRFAEFAEALYQKEKLMSDNAGEFTVNRSINAPRHIVWKARTTPAYLERWWVPKPLTATVTGFDLRPGGAFNLVMRDPRGSESLVSGAFLEITPEERIVFTTALSEDWRPGISGVPITAYISMTDEGETTGYATRVIYKDYEDRQKLETMDFPAGWSMGIDQLEVLVAELKA
jgi:uncharacterized protein YndB with AHSA1/START domain/DNA-binding transcriptional ArsR family regulator